MKKIIAILLSIIMLLSFCSVTAFATEGNDISKFEFPTPKAPNYFVYTDGDANEGSHDELRMVMVVDSDVASLASEYYADSEAFYKKYGLYSFNIVMQYDVSLDGEDNWQYTSEWDTNCYNGSYGEGFQSVSINTEMMEDFEFFWLTYHEGQGSDTFVPYQDAIITEIFYGDGYENEIYSFDVENHSLYIRCRYYMEWEELGVNEYGEYAGPKHSKVSDWSESAVFGKNSTQIIPDEPSVYEAPIISDIKIVTPVEEGDSTYIEYVQFTPESVWEANIYYLMTGNGWFDGLETQVSIDGGDFVEFDTADSWGDWCLYNGARIAFNDDIPVDFESRIKLRVRFTGSHGPSPWSNVLDTNSDAGIIGDVNADEKVNISDVTMIQRHIAQITTISEYRFVCADVDKDNKITIMDATLIQRYIAQDIPSL